jgi:type IX secretion system PorP/SprF family membrane protein
MNFKKSTPKLSVLFFILICFISGNIQAQDIHFSQFENAFFLRSPALTGVFNGDMRFHSNYRAQWYNVPVSYRTFNVGFEKRFSDDPKDKGFFSGGLVFNHDVAGDSQMSSTAVGLLGSYTHRLTKSQALTAGLQVAGHQRAFKVDELRWDEQFDGKTYVPTLSPNESTLFNNKTIFYADFSIGLNWHFRSQKKKTTTERNTPKRRSRTTIDLGAGWFHVNQPEKSFFEDQNVQLPARFSVYGHGVFDVGENVDLLLNAMGQYQGPYVGNLISAGGKFHLNDRLTKELAVALGLGYRFNDGFGQADAFYPYIQLYMKAWQFGLSYDINVSDFEVATGGLGGPEFSMIYTFKKVPMVEFCPTCPVYL